MKITNNKHQIMINRKEITKHQDTRNNNQIMTNNQIKITKKDNKIRDKLICLVIGYWILEFVCIL